MNSLDSQLEQLIADRCKREHVKSNLEVEKEGSHTLILKRQFDVVIYRCSNPLATMEVKTGLENKMY